MEAKQIDLCCDLAFELPPVVCRPAKIHQVFYNLIQNAVQACAESGRVVLRTSRADDGNVMVEVQDDGDGIAESDLINSP